MTTATISTPIMCCPPSPHKRSRRKLRTLWESIQRWQHRRRTAQRLYRLPDRQLKDIGLQRSEIGSLVYGEAADRIRMLELTRK